MKRKREEMELNGSARFMLSMIHRLLDMNQAGIGREVDGTANSDAVNLDLISE
jgi:hypothetical protein